MTRARIKTVPLAKLVCDWSLYPRTQVSSTRVQQLVDAIEAGAELPPIAVLPDLRILDGWHRYRAYRALGIAEVSVRVVEAASEADAYVLAVQANTDHGLPLQAYDRRRVVLRLQELGLEVERIAEIVRVPVSRIEELRRASAVDPQGRPVPVKRGLSHLAGKTLTPHEAAINRRYQGFRPAFYVRQLLDYLATDPPIDDELARELARLRAELAKLPLGEHAA